MMNAWAKVSIFKTLLCLSVILLNACRSEDSNINRKVNADFEFIKSMLISYELKNGSLAVNHEDIFNLVIKTNLKDPWGNDYLVGYVGSKRYVMASAGADKILNNEDDHIEFFTL